MDNMTAFLKWNLNILENGNSRVCVVVTLGGADVVLPPALLVQPGEEYRVEPHLAGQIIYLIWPGFSQNPPQGTGERYWERDF